MATADQDEMARAPLAEILPSVELLETDDEPLESPWHRACMNLLIDVVKQHHADRTDYYVGGNMFIYYCVEQAETLSYRGPDFFFVKGVDGKRVRRYWVVWEEGGKYPDVLIELTSPTTAKVDRTTKKDLYEQTFRTPEYFLYDPGTQKLTGWRHDGQRYQPIAPDERGWLWCEQLGLWLGTWEGEYLGEVAVWLRFYDREGKQVSTFAELARKEANRAKQEADAAKQEADASKQEADAAKQEADAAKHRAAAADQRAESAEERAAVSKSEMARLKAWLAEQGLSPPES